MPNLIRTDKPPATPVIFRAFPNGEVVALFPTEPYDDTGRDCVAYVHNGQHTGANYVAIIYATRPAKYAEYIDLLKELERIGYKNLTVFKKVNAKYHIQRRETARRTYGGR
jgi:hypothetical protein